MDSFSENILSPQTTETEREGGISENRRQEAIQTLSSRGISSSQYDRKMIDAAGNGNTELVRLFLTAGADVNAVDSNGWTPLFAAARDGHTEVVKLLLAAPGSDVNKAPKYGKAPLHRAERGNHEECARLIREAGGKR